MEKLQGWVEKGGTVVITSGVNSTNKMQGSFVSATVTVYDAGTLNLSTIYSDNSLTPKANPFTANTSGYFFFYAANARYDLTFSGGGLSAPFSETDFLLQDLSSGGLTSLNGLTPAAQTLTVGTAGTDFAIVDATADHLFNLPTASAANRGALSTTDWSTFNSKQATITVTTPVTLSGADIGLTTVPIAKGGTGQVTKTAAFDGLSPGTTKGDIIAFDGTNNVRLGVGSNNTALVADSGQATGLKWAAVPTSPVSVANGGTGLTTLTGFAYGAGTTALTAVAASSQLQVLRRTPNVSTLAYNFAPEPYIVASDFDFPSQAPGGTLTATVGASITLTPVPLGVNGADTGHYVYISAGTGSAEAVLITGGSAVSGGSTGTLTFTPANNHSGAWTVTSATQGIQEAISYLPTGVNEVWVTTGATVLNANLSYMGKSNVIIVICNGVTFSGAGTFPSPAAGTFIIDKRNGTMWPGKGAALTSASTITPTNQVHHVTGAAAIDTITVPTGVQSGYAMFLIADAGATTTTGGNIGKALTLVANVAYAIVWDGTKWYFTTA